jgi:hypothetical protein
VGANNGKEKGSGMSEPKIAFKMRKVRLALEQILPTRILKTPKNVWKYQTIVLALKTVGLVEPLVVYPQPGSADAYILLDGHLRHAALKQLGEKKVDCIIATEDERFTYNARINKLPTIQCHKMIVKAVHNGVRVERIAAALAMPLTLVRGLISLLDGINEEAADLLKDKNVSPRGVRLLKKVTGLRQIEIAELMVGTNNYTTAYTEALVLGTPKDQLVSPDTPKEKSGMTAEAVAKLEREMEMLERDFKSIEGTFSENVMVLTLARGYIKKLLDNGKVVRFLKANYGDFLAEFETIVTSELG